MKIGIQDFHPDEIISLKSLFTDESVEIYSWPAHRFDEDELKTCDFLVLFARRQWRYLKFNIPYVLILADYVNETKALNLSKKRKFTLLGYQYSNNNLFKGYLCGSTELRDSMRQVGLKAEFYPKKYPYAALYDRLTKLGKPAHAETIVTLINSYKHTASSHKWNKPANSFYVYKRIVEKVKKFVFQQYGTPGNALPFEAANEVQFNARYTLHVKYWGHVCNAVVKSLALGTPVIMDETTFKKGRYQAYVKHKENGLILNSEQEIVDYLNSAEEKGMWNQLKANCERQATQWHLPYSNDEKKSWKSLFGIGEKVLTESSI